MSTTDKFKRYRKRGVIIRSHNQVISFAGKKQIKKYVENVRRADGYPSFREALKTVYVNHLVGIFFIHFRLKVWRQGDASDITTVAKAEVFSDYVQSIFDEETIKELTASAENSFTQLIQRLHAHKEEE